MSVQSLLPGGMSKAVISIGNVFPDPVGKQLRTWLFFFGQQLTNHVSL